MRLIDADAFIEYLGLDAERSREDNLGEIVTLEDFDRQPTVYDVDKVVEQAQEYSYSNICDSHDGCPYVDNENINCENCGAIGVLEIVESGGVE